MIAANNTKLIESWGNISSEFNIKLRASLESNCCD